jgi:hypothetical protein
MEWKYLRALLLRGRALTARDGVEPSRAVLIEAGLNHGCTDASLAHCIIYWHRFVCYEHGASLRAVTLSAFMAKADMSRT